MDLKPATATTTTTAQLQQNDVEQFLYDVRAHFRASLATSEYENTSNLFHVTAADETERLLERCELLLRQCARASATTQPTSQLNAIDTKVNGPHSQHEVRRQQQEDGDFAYMEMATTQQQQQQQQHQKQSNSESIETRCSAASDKTFRSSMHDHDDEPQIYDICQVSTSTVDSHNNNNSNNNNNNNNSHSHSHSNNNNNNSNINGSLPCDAVDAVDDETQRAITPDLELAHAIDCPYMDLPAGHLAIQGSTKFGQLQRIEKRLFFDQSKKCYCGVLNDWLLCYADGPTASNPTITLHLRCPGIEIEHFGEGKRREVCFQITTADPTKKFVFQANNEVDAKEWIHAIETAIRTSTSIMKLTRKLPTPPVAKKVSFSSSTFSDNQHSNAHNDRIYEEPSPIYDCFIASTDTLTSSSHSPEKQMCTNASVKQYEYDVPKSPPQPVELISTESETAELLTAAYEPKMPPNATTPTSEINKVDFQTKVKDLHSKLSSQLSAGPNPERLKKAIKKTYSCSSNDAEAISLTNNSPTCAMKDQKKQKKSNTPNSSPQKPQAKDTEKSAKNWFLNRLNKTNSSSGSNSSSPASNNNSVGCGSGSANSLCNTPKTKCKQSEKENLLNSLDAFDNFDGNGELFNQSHQSSNPTSPCLKNGGESKSKVNMIINQFENSGHLATMFSVEALAANALASLTSFCDSDCNNYEPIMTVSTPPNSFMKKV